MESLGRGAVTRVGDKVDWKGALHTIQAQLGQKIHVGGKTALELHGYAHQVPVRQKITLFASPNAKLPAWFTNHEWGTKFKLLTTNLFSAWDLLKINGLNRLPSINWKLSNIKKMSSKKHQEALDKIKSILRGTRILSNSGNCEKNREKRTH